MKHARTSRLSNLIFSVGFLLLVAGSAHAQTYQFAFQNPFLPTDERVANLVAQLTLDEKISQMEDQSPPIPRLGIPFYNWHNEAAHGAWNWTDSAPVTVFPQVIGMAASWDPHLIHTVASDIADELRAIYFRTRGAKAGNGLNAYAPNMNIFRDPRWGRGQETYGEDPYLTARMSVEYIKGLQGDDPNYWKVSATAKHFAVYSGPEESRPINNVNVSDKDLWETYLPSFQTAVQEGHVHGFMCAYGSVDGAPMCANQPLLADLLRKKWGFDGMVGSDCGAIRYIWSDHHYASDDAHGSAAALKAGTDLSCQGAKKTNGRLDYSFLKEAVQLGLVSENEINASVSRLFSSRFHLGAFDPDAMVPYSKIPSQVDSPAYQHMMEQHRLLAIKTAQESMVLLKNKDQFLPLSKKLKKVAVIGPNAFDHFIDENRKPINVLLGTYEGTPKSYVTALEGIKKKLSPDTEVAYLDGTSDVTDDVQGSDVAILVLGLEPLQEDQGIFPNGEGEGTDRDAIELPPEQENIIQEVEATGVPYVVVMMNGSALASVHAQKNANAILEAWYPGQEGGTAIADVLFGDYNPGGRMPVTVYQSTDDLPDFNDYRMVNRTYRYFQGEPLYRFGDGLSFSQFQYSNLQLSSSSIARNQKLKLQVDVQNAGLANQPARSGDEVVEVYVSGPAGLSNQPIRSLKSFARVHFAANEKKTLTFALNPSQLSIVDEKGVRAQVPGTYTISVGSEQPRTGSSTPTTALTSFVITP
jgi:beta-glucosidase